MTIGTVPGSFSHFKEFSNSSFKDGGLRTSRSFFLPEPKRLVTKVTLKDEKTLFFLIELSIFVCVTGISTSLKMITTNYYSKNPRHKPKSETKTISY